jgi:hypothetical protein
MSDFLEITRRANQEIEDNRRKSIHNFDCDLSELQPYNNAAFLEMVKYINLSIANIFRISKDITDV